jgi:hypothetical protein
MNSDEFYLKIDQLEIGKTYACTARNFESATWNGKEFEGMRTKFGQTGKTTELHWDSDPRHGTVKPIKLMG